MIKYIILGCLILIAFVFIILMQQAHGYSYKGDKEVLSSDVIDDDIDDPYHENDWEDVAYNENDFEEDDYNSELEMFDDMFN